MCLFVHGDIHRFRSRTESSLISTFNRWTVIGTAGDMRRLPLLVLQDNTSDHPGSARRAGRIRTPALLIPARPVPCRSIYDVLGGSVRHLSDSGLPKAAGPPPIPRNPNRSKTVRSGAETEVSVTKIAFLRFPGVGATVLFLPSPTEASPREPARGSVPNENPSGTGAFQGLSKITTKP